MRVVEELAANRRFHEITLDEVAEAAGVGKGTIYHYFADKDELFFQVAAYGFEELCELLRRTVPCDVLFAEKLLNACKQITVFFDTRRPLLQMMQTEANFAYCRKGEFQQRWQDKRRILLDVLVDIFREGVAEGIVCSDISAEVMATLLLGLLRTRARDIHNAPEDMKNCELLLDVFLNGVHMSSEAVPVQNMAAAEAGYNF